MEPENSEFTSEFFDNASKAWLENKIRCGCAYAYRCSYTHSNHRKCVKVVTDGELCKQHFILIKSQNKQFK